MSCIYGNSPDAFNSSGNSLVWVVKQIGSNKLNKKAPRSQNTTHILSVKAMRFTQRRKLQALLLEFTNSSFKHHSANALSAFLAHDALQTMNQKTGKIPSNKEKVQVWPERKENNAIQKYSDKLKMHNISMVTNAQEN